MASNGPFDYIVVGAGSAGCVLAHRLSADPNNRVLLLEAGPRDRSIYLQMPAAFSQPLGNDRFNWYYHTEPEPYMDHRRIYFPQGKVLGGSSSINGMVYVRGNPLEYEHWAEIEGLEHWSYGHVLPYFKRSETWEAGRNEYHGTDGPLYTSRDNAPHRLDQVFIQAAIEAGLPFTEDMNGYRQEGIGKMDMTVHQGRRWSAADAYLHPVLTRSNLTLELRVLVTRILFNGHRAIGVEYLQDGQTHRVYAECEVLLSAGALNSPWLLMLSGVGNSDELRQLDIPVVHHLPGVGENLQDHLEVYVQYACTQPITLYSTLSPFSRLKIGLHWLLFKRGQGASNHFEVGGFLRTRADYEYPNIQYHFLPMAISYDGSVPHAGHGFQAHVGPMNPTSVGHVKLRSNDPRVHPKILCNYLQTEEDRRVMREAIRLTRTIFAQKAFNPYRGREIAPGAGRQSDEELDAFARTKGESAYHPAGTCKMGHDEMAVVDGFARVHGIEGLRVVDASLIPKIVNSNLNGPTIMIAEKVADMVLGREPLPPSDVPFYVAGRG